MKKFFMMVALAAATVSASAQIYVGGGFGFNSAKNRTTDKTITSFEVMPEVGIQLNDAWAFGLQLGYENRKDAFRAGDSEFEHACKITSYSRLTFARWGIIGLFAQNGMHYRYASLGDKAEHQFGFAIKPGISIDLTDNFTILAKFANLGYTHTKGDWDGAKANNAFDLNMDADALEFSLQYYF